MDGEPIKFIFKPTKRILTNFFEPLKKKRSTGAKSVDSISKRYYLIEAVDCFDGIESARKLKIEFEQHLSRTKGKSWSDLLFAPKIHSMSSVSEDEEEIYVPIPESSELDEYEERLDGLSNIVFHDQIPDDDFQNEQEYKDSKDRLTEKLLEPSESIRHSSPVRDYGSNFNESKSGSIKTYTTNKNNPISSKTIIPPKQIILIDSDDENEILGPSKSLPAPLSGSTYLDQPLFDSNFSVGNDLAKQLFGDDIDEISEYEKENDRLPSKTIVIDDSSDNEIIVKQVEKNISDQGSGAENSLNDPILQQLRNQFKPKEKVGKKRASKADTQSTSVSRSTPKPSKPYYKRFNRGGWKGKKKK